MKTTAEKSTHSKPTTSHHGQEAVGRFIPPTVQPKLTVNSPDDPLEREADAMASQVVAGGATPQLQDGNNLRRKEMDEEETVQRQVGEEEEEMVQRQADEEEEEQVQRQVSEEEEEVVQLQVSEEEEEVVQLQASEDKEEEQVQRQCTDCKEEETVQRATTGSTGASQSAPPIVGSVVSSAGRPLDTSTRRGMEGSFGADFSGVRVHNDQQAQQSARAISAQAYTYGNHIAFAPGKYEPHTQRGQHLLAHELTHVVQQGEGVQRRVDNSNTTSPSIPGTTNAPAVGTTNNTPAPLPPATGPAPIQSEAAGTAPQAPAAPPAVTPEVLPAEGGASPEPAASAPLEPLMPPPPETLGPAARSRLGNAQQNAGTAAAANADLPAAEDLTQEARGGVTEPTAETDARASGALAASLSERLAPSPEILELCANIRRIIRERRPPDEESLTSADPEAAANAAGSELNDNIDADVDRVEGDYDELDENPTGTPEQVGESVETPPTEVDEPAIRAAGATPDPLTPEDISLDADAANSAQQMADAGMSTPVAAEIQDGPVAAARDTQQELEESAAVDPAVVLAEQDAALMSSRADMEALQARALQALENSRAGSVNATGTQQQEMVGSEVDQREVLGERAETIFTDAQNQVNTLLEPLTSTAMEMWDNGKERIATEFEQHLARVQSWIDDRHSGFGGGLTELWDDLTGLPDWVTDEYNDAERDFGDSVCELIQEISLFVNGVIVTCEELIDTANQQIDDLFANAGPELAEWAATQREQFQGRLDGLREQVSTTQQDFNRDLTDRASQAVQEVREQVHALREAARGLLGQIANAIAEFLDDPIRAIINGLLRLVGIDPGAFWALAARIEQVISDIANDPLGFASNLLAAIGAGFDLFFDNFFTHLFEGFIQWIFSGLGAVGVEIPSDFSLSSIITFFLQLMGITWERIRMLLARHIGEENVALLEQAYGIISDLIELGPAGIFEMIKDQLDPQQILDQVIQMAVDFVIETLVTQATIRIALLFNPVGAIAQAIEAIYKILKWIFQNAARIFTLVESVVNGMADIIAGNIAGMAATVENALARLLVPVIDFVAEFMSLGGLPERVADMVRGLQAWVEGILDRVIGWLAGQARAILSALGISEDADPEAEGEAAGGELEDSEVGASINFQAGGEQHRLWVNASGGQIELMVASDTPMSVAARLTQWEGRVSELAADDQGRARSLIGVVRSQYEHVKDEGEQAQQALDEAQTDPSAEAIAHAQQEDTQVEQAEQAMTDELGALFDLFEGGVQFQPINQQATVGGTSFALVIDKSSDNKLLVKLEGVEIISQFSNLQRGPLGTANHRNGRTLVRQIMVEITPINNAIKANQLRDGKLPSAIYLSLDGQLAQISSSIQQLEPTKAQSWSQLLTAPPTTNISTSPVEFAQGLGNSATITAEYDRQLQAQQAGINQLSVDQWIINRNAYSLDDNLFLQLDAEQRRAVLVELQNRADNARDRARRGKQNYTDAIAAILEAFLPENLNDPNYTPDFSNISRVTGRFGNESSWRRQRRSEINTILQDLRQVSTNWDAIFNSSAVLHNADQIAGGFGQIPDITRVPRPGPNDDDQAWKDYLDALRQYVGSANVNSSIGSLWRTNIVGLENEVRSGYPAESWPVWKMNVTLRRT